MIENITVLVDNDSWILPYAKDLVDELNKLDKNATLAQHHDAVNAGDVCFFLGCTKIAAPSLLSKNKFNLVVHESALPQGKGFAPIAWQILEGQNEIPVCLIEACDDVDAGDIWLTDTITLNGTELACEWRELQGLISIKLAVRFVNEFGSLVPKKQTGQVSFYPRRRASDSELDVSKTLAELIPLLRTVDNEDYPAFFEHEGCKYKLEISKYE
ncbi:formyltransferase family protein [Shewanella kaireitica]|uniref:formyltransferase family protein n=1 Tax=Shewanella kaireitica TaxID=212021 RepID=UPI00200E0144|nr:formyltransferase family protein [Shewanella kaireitica]MCL1093799.1 methionyl-tRNA formyltransferase [Shewanella kaireitica]